MFLTELLPVEIWMHIYKIEHKMINKDVLNEIEDLSQQIKELNQKTVRENAIIQKTVQENELWTLLKWSNFKIEFNKTDFFGRCQEESFKYFNVPKNHKCALC